MIPDNIDFESCRSMEELERCPDCGGRCALRLDRHTFTMERNGGARLSWLTQYKPCCPRCKAVPCFVEGCDEPSVTTFVRTSLIGHGWQMEKVRDDACVCKLHHDRLVQWRRRITPLRERFTVISIVAGYVAGFTVFMYIYQVQSGDRPPAIPSMVAASAALVLGVVALVAMARWYADRRLAWRLFGGYPRRKELFAVRIEGRKGYVWSNEYF